MRTRRTSHENFACRTKGLTSWRPGTSSIATVSVSTDRSLLIAFEPNAEHGADCQPLALEFSEVDFLEVSDEIGAKGIRDIDELGYKEPTDRDDEWLMSEEQASSRDHLFIRLIGGHFIRVHAKRAALTERNATRLQPLSREVP